jgi:hypothetical protein
MSQPPLRTGLAAFTASSSALSVLFLHEPSLPEAFLCISLAPRESSVDSSRVRWVPLLRSFRKLGAFTFSPHPGVLSFPECRLLCPIHLSPQASGFALGSRCPPSTSLRILAKVSRVHHVGLRRGAVGGALLTAPSALCGSPVPAWDKQVPPCALLRRELSAPHRVLLAPCDFRLDWLTSQLRYVRVPLFP